MKGRRVGRESEGGILSSLAQAYLGAGQIDRARRTVEEAVRLAREGGQIWEIYGLIVQARVLLAALGTKAYEEVKNSLARAMKLVNSTGARAWEPQIIEERANLARCLGDDAEYQRELRNALRDYQEIGATGHARRVEAEL